MITLSDVGLFVLLCVGITIGISYLWIAYEAWKEHKKHRRICVEK